MQDLLTRKEPLCEELQDFTYKKPKLGTCIHHPLVIQIMIDPEHCAWINEHFRLKKERLAQSKLEKDWMAYLFIHERPYRLQAFVEIMYELSSTQYWNLLGNIWTDSENIYQNEPIWRELWQREVPDIHTSMDEEELAIFKNLPSNVQLYRGYDIPKRKKGISWMLELEKAIWFARRFKQHKPEHPKVVTINIPKENIIALFCGRNEAEAIVPVIPRRTVFKFVELTD